METTVEMFMERLDKAVKASGMNRRVIDRASSIATGLQLHHAFFKRTLPVEEAVAKLEEYVASGRYLQPIRFRITKGSLRRSA